MQKINEEAFVLVSSPFMHNLGDELCEQLKTYGVTLGHQKLEVTTFASDEQISQIPYTVRGQHVFFLHALQQPNPGTAAITMFSVNDAMIRASATGITLVLPFMTYLRQDRKDKPRVPITARVMADLTQTVKIVQHIITMDMHTEQAQGFYVIPVDNLTGVKIFSEHLRSKYADDLQDVVMLAPDFGGAVRNRRMALVLDERPVCIMEKRRTGPNKAEIMSIIGEGVEDKIVVIYEDMIDTGGTALKVIERVKALGAREVYLCGTHGIFSKNAEKLFQDADVKVACTDTIPRTAEYYAEHASWLTKVSVVPYFAKAIYESMLVGGSISKLELQTSVHKEK